jgi:hypothetical protein
MVSNLAIKMAAKIEAFTKLAWQLIFHPRDFRQCSEIHEFENYPKQAVGFITRVYTPESGLICPNGLYLHLITQ